ncbi:hypothetical protein QUF64_05460 [Anaerolineales bacterium HSG6]|nr:hypothetical protein [Anaerolineales bacterium HSG6]MDM8532498.1 hypothetical protein [Anaerolineales bacterium HSG25]
MSKKFSGQGTGPGGIGNKSGTSALKLWLRGDIDVTTNNGRVVWWADQSGCGNHGRQSNLSHQPTFVASNPDFNGMPTVNFNGYNHFLRIAHSPSLDMKQGLTVFMVFKPHNLQTNSGLLSKGPTNKDAGNYALTIKAQQQRLQFEHYDRKWWHFASSNPVPTKSSILSFSFDTRNRMGVFGLNGNLIGYFKDRFQMLPNRRSLKIGLHQRHGLVGDWFNGDIAELIIYQNTINTAQRIIVENYLSAKYGIAPLPRTRTSKDIYSGNFPQHGSYTLDVAGIGYEADGRHSIAQSAELAVIDRSFLKDRGDYLLVGHKSPTNAKTSSNMDDKVGQRWERVWFFDLTDKEDNSGEVTLRFDRTAIEHAGSSTGMPVLVEQIDETDDFNIIASPDEVTDTSVSFTISTRQLVSGRSYTLGYNAQESVLGQMIKTVRGSTHLPWRKADESVEKVGRTKRYRRKVVDLMSKNQQLLLQDRITPDDVSGAFSDMIKAIKGELSRDVLAKVEDIQGAMQDALPYINDINSSDPNVYMLRETVLQYLPEALQNYMNLPPKFATQQPLKDGQTARQILLEQLDLLSHEMTGLANDYHHRKAEKMLVHGRFLEEKFGGQEDSLLD